MIIGTRLIGCYCAALLTINAVSVRNAVAQRTTTIAPAAAIALETKANGWLSMPKKWNGVARALERAAEIRGAEDPAAIGDLFLAGAARRWVGQPLQAQAVFTQAAEWALANGDVETAAIGYTHAAVIAFEAKNFTPARELRDKAARLARSPLLSVAQRKFILSQFVHAPTSVAVEH